MPDEDEQRIVAAAWLVLERSHFRTLKVRQVLAASGVSANGFYRRFPSKSTLLIALVEDEMARVTTHLAKRMVLASDPRERLRVWVEDLVDIAYDERRAERARMFLDPVLEEEQPRELDRLHRATLAPLERTIADGVAAGVFRSDDPELDARAIYHMVRGFTADRLAGVHDWPVERATGAVLGLARRALAPPDEGPDG